MDKTLRSMIVYALIATTMFGVCIGVRIVKSIKFDVNCTQYLERAIDSDEVKSAKEELAKAISYAEQNNLTEGTVSIFFNQPVNDIGYWYRNMKNAYDELESFEENPDSSEEANLLMKLKDTLTKEGRLGTSIKIPAGISIYPYNTDYFIMCTCLLILSLWLWISAISCRRLDKLFLYKKRKKY